MSETAASSQSSDGERQLQEINRRLRIESGARLAAERDMERFFELSLDLLCISHSDGYFKRVSPAFTRTLGWTTEELLATPYLAFIHPDDVPRTIREVERQIADGQLVLQFENRYRHKDGSWRLLSWKSAPQPDGFMYAIARDVTERDEAEKALRRSHDELEQRVRERTAELEARNHDLQTLLYVTSHDLREPLRTIASFSSLLEKRYAGQLDDTGLDFLGRVIRAAHRMESLMNDVLALSRARRMEPPCETVSGRELVQGALRQLEETIRDTKAQVRVMDPLPELVVNKTWARQALYNLIANALKFHRPGEAPAIEIAAIERQDRTESEAGFVVRDRGIGVKPEHARRIFELFQRAVGREIPGTGAGLAIVQQVAQRHGGRAWAKPREGGGTEFFLTFQEKTESDVRRET